MKKRLLSLALLAFAFSSASAAQPKMTPSVKAEYDVMFAKLKKEGYKVFEYYAGDLADGKSTTTRVSFDSGFTWAVAGFCDEDCNAVYLQVAEDFRPDPFVIISDDEDARPLVEFDVPEDARTNTFNVTVKMGDCQASPCQYAFALFYK